MTILIADDHAVVREGLKQLLSGEFPQVEFRLASTVRETLEKIRQGRLDLLVLDLFMPDGNGLEALQEVRLIYPRLPVLVFSNASEEQLGMRMLRAGANGYLDKQSAPEKLVEAVRKILGGGRYLSMAIAEQLAEEIHHGDRPLHNNLSVREFQILHLVVNGRCLKKIASDLFLSVKTIRTYHARLLAKLRLQSDVDLVHYAMDHHLVERTVAPLVLSK
jgi:DNA-binding NarL/FixJ family response regulator